MAYTRNIYPVPLGSGQLSWGFFPLQRIQAAKVHGLPFDRKTSEESPRTTFAFAGKSHPTSFGAAHELSQLHSDLFLSLPSYHFQAGGTLGVLPFRDLILLQSLQQLVAAGIPSCRFSFRMRNRWS